MREIKFRAWNGKQMFYIVVGSSYEDGPCSIVWMENKKEWVNHDGDISQYTGLKDKNGKEIYEGDIVINLGQDCGTDGIFYNDTCDVISWNEKECGFKPFTYPADWLLDKCEVIGNIYENKELLEEK